MKSRPSLLLIEQDEGLRRLLTYLLKAEYNTTVAKNALEGLSHLFNNSLPDLLIIDLDTKDIEGVELVEQIKTNGMLRDIPIIALYTEQEKRISTSIYIEALIQKPFDPNILKEKVIALTSSKSVNKNLMKK